MVELSVASGPFLRARTVAGATRGDGELPFVNSVIDQWKTQLIALPPSDRVELAHFLLSSLEPDDEGIEAAWDAEALRRIA